MKRSIALLLMMIYTIINSTLCSAEILTPARWTHELSSNHVEVGDTVDIVFTAKIDKDWYLYSSDFDPELGPMVTTFKFDENGTYRTIGDIIPYSPKKKYDALWEGEYTYFKEKGVFRQRIVVTSLPIRVSGSYSYQVCSDVDGKCIPFDEDFNLSNKVTAYKEDNLKEVKDSGANNPLSDRSLWEFAIFAFFGGLAALFTPCVFPLIPMTVSYFTGKKKKKAVIYGVFIILIYSVIGSLLAPLMGPTMANELATGWVPNLIFFSVFVVFALSFFGLFDLTLPSGLVNAMDAKSEKEGLIGVFFMAFTLVLVTFSCTGPIAGSILVKSAGGEVTKPIVGMFAYSLAFAIPFMLFALFPALLQKLPKSGGWLNSVKVVLGFVEFAFAFKFLSVADQAYHWGILDRDVYLSIWIVTFSLMGFYLLGKIRLPHDSPMEKIPVFRMVFAICTFSFVVYLIPGLFGAPLRPLSGYLPPLTGQDFNLYKVSEGEKLYANPTENCEEPLYSNLLHLPHGIQGYFDYDQALACAKEQNKPLFIDFTGHGCVNCREMEARVWSHPEVLKRLKEDFIVVALYVDDKQQLPKSKWKTSDYDGKIKKTLGLQNADLQITKFENNAQPFYPVLNAEGELLIDPPMGYDLKIANFVNYLDKAKSEFTNNKPTFEGFSAFK